MIMAVGVCIFIHKRNTMSQGKGEAQLNVTWLDKRKTPQGISFKSIAEGKVAMPRKEEFEKIYAYEETIGSRFTRSFQIFEK